VTVLVAILLAVFVLPHPWGVAAVAGALLFELAEAWVFIAWSRRRTVRMGVETLVGADAVVAGDGLVRVQGELWQARGAPDAQKGDRVRVLGVDGLVLEVEPL
jgi:membrane-bound serine protease (ClpP class)